LRGWLRVAGGGSFTVDDPLIGQFLNQFGAGLSLAVDESLESAKFVYFAFGEDVVFDARGDGVDGLLASGAHGSGRQSRVELRAGVCGHGEKSEECEQGAGHQNTGPMLKENWK